jgi:hypothetical protein
MNGTQSSFLTGPDGTLQLSALRKTERTLSILSDDTCKNKLENDASHFFTRSQVCTYHETANSTFDMLDVGSIHTKLF